MSDLGKRKLQAKMKEFGEKQSDLAKAIGICLSRLNAKLNHKNGAQFSLSDISAIKEHYGLSAEEVDSIFFS